MCGRAVDYSSAGEWWKIQEKRMKLEERQMENEQQERKEEREFKLQIMQMSMQGISTHSTQAFTPAPILHYPQPPAPLPYSHSFLDDNHFEQ